jgi:hypothetical protein
MLATFDLAEEDLGDAMMQVGQRAFGHIICWRYNTFCGFKTVLIIECKIGPESHWPLKKSPTHTQDYSVGRTLGRGRYGKVKQAVHVLSGVPVCYLACGPRHISAALAPGQQTTVGNIVPTFEFRRGLVR